MSKYAAIISTLHELNTDKNITPDCRAKARDAMLKLNNPTSMFDLMTMKELAVTLEQISKNIQFKTLTAEEALRSHKEFSTRKEDW